MRRSMTGWLKSTPLPLGVAIGLLIAALLVSTASAQGSNDWPTVTDSTPWGTIGATVAVSPPKAVFLVPFIAQQEGFFDREHLHVKLVPETSGVPAFLSTVAGSTKFSFTSATDPIIAASHGKAAHVIWSYGLKLDTVCIGGDGIKTAKDLVGKNVGVTDTGGFAQTLLQACLAPEGVSLDSVHMIHMQRSGFVPAMVSHRISAAVFHADGAYVVLQKDPGVHVLAYEYQAIPDWWYGALAANDAYVKANPGEVKRFLRALVLASRWMYDPANKAKVIADGAKASGEDPAAIEYAYNLMIKGHIWPLNAGLPTQQSYQYTAQKLKDFGEIDTIPSYDQTIDASYIDAVLQNVGTATAHPGARPALVVGSALVVDPARARRMLPRRRHRCVASARRCGDRPS
ncbi:MAG: ABC transporter substrate-binding protein [Deinococcales bacterium]